MNFTKNHSITFYCDSERHLICKPYSVDNLHRMAEILEIHNCWFHNHKRYPHYDIPKKRIEEIQSKCIVITPKELLSIIKNC